MIGRVLSRVVLLVISYSSAVLSQNPPPEGDIIISEVFVRSSDQNNSWQWVELYNRSNQTIDLSKYSLGSAGDAGVDQNYTQTLVQLNGNIAPYSFFIVGGPNSNASNGDPIFDQKIDFEPDFADGRSSADGVALYHERAKDVRPQSIPKDVVIYGDHANNNRLVDNKGEIGVIDIRRPDVNTSIERINTEPNQWRIQSSPSPNSIISPVNFKTYSSEEQKLRLAAGDSLLLIIRADIIDNFGNVKFNLNNNPDFIIELKKKTTYCDESPCVSSYTLLLIPKIDDAGNYSFGVTSEYHRSFSSEKRTINFDISVVPKIIEEPVFSPNLINEITWVPLNAFNQELVFFPRQNLSDKSNNPKIIQGSSRNGIITETIENLNEGIKYGYYVKALVEEDGDFIELVSDTVFSVQDNTPPKPVLIDTFDFRNDGRITVGWDIHSTDKISYIEEFIIFRRSFSETEFTKVATVYPQILKDLQPANLLPETLQVGDPYYLDKTNVLLQQPNLNTNPIWIRTNFKERWNSSKRFISFKVSGLTRVNIAYDSGAKTLPDWLKKFSSTNEMISIDNFERPYKVYYKDFDAGEIVLGGNFAEGANFGENAPGMYLIFLEDYSKNKSYVYYNRHIFIDNVDINLSGEQFIYRVDAVDVVGNLSHGIDSTPIKMDATPPCAPSITSWFNYHDPITGKTYSQGDMNTICAQLGDCKEIAGSDSIRFEAVRDSLKFFNLPNNIDLPGRLFRSTWLPKDSLCFTFSLQPDAEDPNFVNSHKYFYRAQTKDRFDNVSDWSEIESSIQDIFPPSDISNLSTRIVTRESDCIEITWQQALDPVSGIKSYYIYRSVDGVNYTKIDSVSGEVTTYCDDLSELTSENGVVYYKVGSIDFVQNERANEETDWVASVPIFISPQIYANPSQITSCPSNLPGTQLDTLTIEWDRFNEEGVTGFQIEVNGPEGEFMSNISNSQAVSFDCPLALGDGVYNIKLLAIYTNVVDALYSNTLSFRKKTSIENIKTLTSKQATNISGDIYLSWFHPDTADIVEFQIYNWVEGEEFPDEPVVRLSGNQLEWVHKFENAQENYQCNYYGVKALDCFGLESQIIDVVASYPNRPPVFDSTKTFISDKEITICWNRISPRYKNDDSYEVIVEVYQDSVTTLPFTSFTVFNQQCATYFSPTPKHNYIFRIKEVVINDLSQRCSDVFESAYSKFLTVPYQNPPKVVNFNAQALPVHPDSTTGRVFVEWSNFAQKAINTFLVQWKEERIGGAVDSVHVAESDTFLISGLDIEQTYDINVFSIDTLLQRSEVDSTITIDFNPRWVFTPKIQKYNPKCFKDSVRIEWDWVLNDNTSAQNNLGADSIQIEISIDSNFIFKKTTIKQGSVNSFTFNAEEHYPFVTNQNNLLYSRVRAMDRWGHYSPWSTEYVDFAVQPASFDFTPPEFVASTIDSIKAPMFGSEGVVDIYLSWNDVSDNCSGTWYYEILRNDSLVGMDTSRSFNHTYIERNLSVTEPILDYFWSVNAVDSAGNRQELAPKSKIPYLISAPDSGWCMNDTTFSWAKVTPDLPNTEITYFVEGARFSSLFGNDITNIKSGPLTQPQFNFNVPWESIYWRVKAVSDNVESPWSETFFCGELSPSNVSSVELNEAQLPEDFALLQNYPNPFNPVTTISYTIPNLEKGSESVRLDVFNITGQRVTTLVNEEKRPGLYQVQWFGTDEYGNQMGTGVYVYSIEIGDFSTSRKMIFLK